MTRSSAELKKLARASLQGKYGTFIGTYLIYTLIVLAASTIISLLTLGTRGSTYWITQVSFQLILSFIWTIFGVGFTYQSMKACREQDISIGDLFYGFTHNPDRFIVVALLQTLIALALLSPSLIIFVTAGIINSNFSDGMLVAGLLLYNVAIVLLIIVMLALSLCFYLIIDNPSMSAMDSLKASWELMKGNKGRLFYISLSFLGLMLLGLLSFGIGMLWVVPYINVTTAYFYFDVIGALDQPVAEVADTPVDEQPSVVEAPVVEVPVVDEALVVDIPVADEAPANDTPAE